MKLVKLVNDEKAIIELKQQQEQRQSKNEIARNICNTLKIHHSKKFNALDTEGNIRGLTVLQLVEAGYDEKAIIELNRT